MPTMDADESIRDQPRYWICARFIFDENSEAFKNMDADEPYPTVKMPCEIYTRYGTEFQLRCEMSHENLALYIALDENQCELMRNICFHYCVLPNSNLIHVCDNIESVETMIKNEILKLPNKFASPYFEKKGTAHHWARYAPVESKARMTCCLF